MSNALTQVREDIKQLLEDAGLFAFTTVPDVAVPPMVYVAPDDPYVTRDGATFGGEIVNCSVVAVVASGINDMTAEALDELVLKVCDAIDASENYERGDVGQAGQLATNGQNHLAAPIAVACEIHR